MSVKAAELIHVGNSILIDRLQQSGPANLNQNITTIYELGDYLSLDRIRDIPDYTMPMQSFDARAQMEAILTGQDYASMADGTVIDMGTCLPINVLGEYKKGKTDADPFGVRAGVILPHLYPESFQYRYGLRQNAAQTCNLRGDSIGWNDASAYEQRFVGSASANQACALTHSALPYNGDPIDGIKYAFSVSLASGKRLFFGNDYTEAPTGAGQAKTVTVTILAAVPATDHIVITYFSPTVAEYPQASNTAASATAPAAIRGKDIEVRVGGTDTVSFRWSGVQSVQWNWQVTLDRDEEFGNPYVVSQDYDVPQVTGTVNIKPRDMSDFIARVRELAGVATGETAGPNTTNPVPCMVTLHSPITGKALKSLFTPDAVFDLPGYNQQVQQKFTQDMGFGSQTGQMYVVKNGFASWDGTTVTGVADS